MAFPRYLAARSVGSPRGRFERTRSTGPKTPTCCPPDSSPRLPATATGRHPKGLVFAYCATVATAAAALNRRRAVYPVSFTGAFSSVSVRHSKSARKNSGAAAQEATTRLWFARRTRHFGEAASPRQPYQRRLAQQKRRSSNRGTAPKPKPPEFRQSVKSTMERHEAGIIKIDDTARLGYQTRLVTVCQV